ncbi:MAG: two-component sensor histidine kinase, partial [Psychromonas sp.]
MRLTIFRKLFISLLLISTIMMVGMALLINNSFQSGLQNYLNQREIEKMQVIAEYVSQYYSPETDWSMIEENPTLWETLLVQAGQQFPRERGRHRRDPSSRQTPLINFQVFLLNAQGDPVLYPTARFKERDQKEQFIRVPIMLDG